MKEIISIELESIYKKNKNIEQTKKDLINYYKLVEKNRELWDKIYEFIDKSKVIEYYTNREIKKLNTILENITKEKKILLNYLSFFVIMSFNNPVNENYFKKENIEEDFSIKFFSYHDITNKISKNINNLNIFISEIEQESNIINSEKKIYEFSSKIINILIKEEIIKEKNIWIKGKTYKILLIEDLKNEYILELYSSKFRIIEKKNIKYLCNNTFYSINEINKVNFRSNERFIMKKKSDVINKLLNYKVMIDKEMLKQNLIEYCNESEIDINNIQKNYNKIIINIKNILEENDIISYREACKILSKYQKALIFEKIIEDDRNELTYYIPFLFDFRGRIYKMSGISPTFFKEIRYCLYLGDYAKKELENQDKNEIDNIIVKYVKIIDDDEHFKKFKDEMIKIKISIIWILISIGEVFKSEIGEKIKIEEFIKKAIHKIKSKEIYNIKKYEDTIKIKYYLKIIEEIEKKIYKKRLVSKDATASVFQHLLKILGPKDEDSQKICNMDSEDTWYDTYSIIINKWKKERSEKLEKIEKKDEIFNRKNLKKIMMTENYGCGIRTAWKYFKKEIKIEFKEEEIYTAFIDFYNYISKENVITKENSSMIIEYFIKKENKKITTSDDCIIDFTYNIMEKKQIDSTYKKRRFTNTYYVRTDKFDKEKFIISIRANYVHSQDASLAREVIKRCNIITIHDCFMIDYLSISKLVKSVNDSMNIEFHSITNKKNKKIFSIFIII